MASIETGKTSDRRVLRFSSPAELRAEAERVVAAGRAGKLRTAGNWTPGQIFGHLAAWIDYAYDGWPADLRPPWIVTMIVRLQKRKFLRGPLPAGVKIPGIAGGTKGTEPYPLEEGYSRFDRAWKRLESSPPVAPNILFGPMPHEEWIAMHLRHAELHLGFLHPTS